MKTRFIHIGYPKTGTSTLQRSFFPRHPGLRDLFMRSTEVRDTVQIEILSKDSLSYSHDRAAAIFAPYFADAEVDVDCVAVGISCEDLALSSFPSGTDRGLIAARLKDIFGLAKVIITVRNQFSIIPSMYSELVKGGIFFSFEEFLEANYWGLYRHLFHQLRYGRLVARYRALFGASQVRVTLFEDFARDPQSFVDGLCDFLDIASIKMPSTPENPSLSWLTLNGLRAVNRAYKNNLGRSYFSPLTPNVSAPGMADEIGYAPPGLERRESIRHFLRSWTGRVDRRLHLKPPKLAFSSEWTERLTNYYAEDNLRLMSETGLDVRSYGYPLPPPEHPAERTRREGLDPRGTEAPSREVSVDG